MNENQTIEYKSIRKIRTGDNGFRDLSVTCVALANAQGGTIYVGYEDKTKEPLPNQHVNTKEINDTLSRLRGLCFNVGISASEIKTHPNGGEYFELYVAPSLKSIATTSDAKIYIYALVTSANLSETKKYSGCLSRKALISGKCYQRLYISKTFHITI